MLIIMKMRPKQKNLRVISNPENKKNCMGRGGGGGDTIPDSDKNNQGML